MVRMIPPPVATMASQDFPDLTHPSARSSRQGASRRARDRRKQEAR
jgi:hypothetical protein